MTRFKHFFIIALVALVAGTAASCEHSDLWDDLSQKVENFINQYFPNSELQAVSNTATTTSVRIDNGPGLTFNADGDWTDLNGFGMPLPQVLLFDQVPPALYNYLQETENLGSVFQLSRKDGVYTARLLNTSVTYNEHTGELKGT